MGDIQLDKATAIKGWMSLIELDWLARVAHCSDKILEIGSYKGRSTRALCDNAKGTVTAVDPWAGPYITNRGTVLFDQIESWNEFQRNLADVPNLTIFRGYFEEFCNQDTDTDFDFIFIDGDHRYDSVIRDIYGSLKLLKSGGILAGHDYTHQDWPGVKRAVDELFPNRELVDSIWWTQKY
jgi:predicted O-methyltransferase YrrM